MSTTNLKKIIHPCNINDEYYKNTPVFCKIEIKNGNLSISGVIGPKRKGDAVGSCGQINMKFDHKDKNNNDERYSDPIKIDELSFMEKWDVEKWYKFLDIWYTWHLNDMQAGCEHQREMKWGSKKLTIYHMELKKEITSQRYNIKRRTEEELKYKGTTNITKEEQKILSLEYSFKADKNTLPKYYDTEKTEEKTENWVSENEHPEGKLSKACPICGYKYGTAWLKVELPVEIIDFLKSLPETDIAPAWC